MDLIEGVYQALRAEVLGRHFAVGRYFPAYHFGIGSVLGEWPACALPSAGQRSVMACDTGACIPRVPRRRTIGTGKPPVRTPGWVARYGNPDDLLALPPSAQLTERWRIWRRDRTNAMLVGALRASALSVEYRLGLTASGEAIERWLDTVETLFHFKDLDSPMAGYFLRYDAVTSDAWEAEIDSKGNERPLRPCEFLPNPDPRSSKDRPYLYGTPASDTRYQALQGSARDRYRHWEPSADEITGLLVALLMIFEAFQRDLTGPAFADRHARAVRVVDRVRTQMRRVARYLQAHAYVLVRPCGGFAFRGASENNPCLEYAFSRAFQHVLGEPFHVNATVEDAFVAAGVFDAVFGDEAGIPALRSELLGRLSSAGILSHLRALLSTSDPLGPLLGAGGTGLMVLKRAVQILQHSAVFDLHAGDGLQSAGAQMAECYLLSKLARPDPAVVFKPWMSRYLAGDSDYKPLLGLIGHVTQDDLIIRSFISLYQDMLTQDRFSDDPADLQTDTRDLALANAIAVLVTAPDPAPGTITGDPPPPGMSLPALRSSLFGRLKGMAQFFAGPGQNQPVLSLHDGGMALNPAEDGDRCCAGANTPQRGLTFEFDDKVGGYHGFLAPTALAWLHAHETAATAPWAALPVPTPGSLHGWKAVVLPAALVEQARTDRLPIPPAYLAMNAGAAVDIDLLATSAPRPPSDRQAGEPEPATGDVHVLHWTWHGARQNNGTQAYALPAPPIGANADWLATHQVAAMLGSVRLVKARLGNPTIADGQVKVDFSLDALGHWPPGEARIDAELIVGWVRAVPRNG